MLADEALTGEVIYSVMPLSDARKVTHFVVCQVNNALAFLAHVFPYTRRVNEKEANIVFNACHPAMKIILVTAIAQVFVSPVVWTHAGHEITFDV